MGLALKWTAGMIGSICLLAACSDDSATSSTPTVAASGSQDCMPADLVIHNTSIYTSNNDQWSAEAVVVRGDRILYVGDNGGAAGGGTDGGDGSGACPGGYGGRDGGIGGADGDGGG